MLPSFTILLKHSLSSEKQTESTLAMTVAFKNNYKIDTALGAL